MTTYRLFSRTQVEKWTAQGSGWGPEGYAYMTDEFTHIADIEADTLRSAQAQARKLVPGKVRFSGVGFSHYLEEAE